MKNINKELLDTTMFKAATLEMFRTFKDKNSLYGNSFSKQVEEFGMLAGVIPLSNKIDRIKSIVKGKDIKFESLEDSLLDLANYATMMLIEVRKASNEQTKVLNDRDNESAMYEDILNSYNSREGFENINGSDVELPTRGTEDAAGYDIKSKRDFIITPGKSARMPLGIMCNVPKGHVLELYPRSSTGSKGLRLVNTVGIIDADYKGEIIAVIENTGNEDIAIRKNGRFLQGVLKEYKTFKGEDKPTKVRGTGGFGSTGK